MPDDLQALVSLVTRLAREEIRPHDTGVASERKGDGSLLTAVDEAMQRRLVEELARDWPGVPTLGEESSGTAQGEVLEGCVAHGTPFWCIDPLDGTSNFVMGFPAYAVSVALVDRDGPLLGVVHDPTRRETFAASRGHGAWLDGRPLPIRDVSSTDLGAVLALVDLKRLPPSLGVRVAAEHPFRSQRNLGSAALEWCWVAAGRCPVYVHGSQKPWDYAAGMLILAEAGGIFRLETDLESGAQSEPKGSPDGDSSGPGVPGLTLEPRAVVAASTPELFAAWRRWIFRGGEPDARS
ncbi:MAG: inositol monophosphatase family protein [Gemmatimonadales bacterium]|nr:MAG: inositol monophosphatase family protein [Gemmatimonadales bacterium]